MRNTKVIKYKIRQNINKSRLIYLTITEQSEELYELDNYVTNNIKIYSQSFPDYDYDHRMLYLRGCNPSQNLREMSIPISHIYDIIMSFGNLNRIIP